VWLCHCLNEEVWSSGPNLFVTADRSRLDSFAAAREYFMQWRSEVKCRPGSDHKSAALSTLKFANKN